MDAGVRMDLDQRGEAPLATRTRWWRLVAAGIVLVVFVVLARSLGAELPRLLAYVSGLGPAGALVFAAAYVAAVVAFVPGSALTLAAGALFGIGKGLVVAWSAATVGAVLSFLVARHLARSAIEARIAKSPRFAAIDRAVAREGLKIVLLLRLSPVFPFTLLNYGLGLTRVRFVDYLVASIGMVPGTLLYVYYGQLIGLAAQLAGGVAIERGPADWIVLALGLVATLAVTIVVTRIARRALLEATGEAENER